MITRPDPLGNRLLDYSSVGYRNGTAPIPVIPVRITLSPQSGDNGAYIQGAINYVKSLPLDTNGFRGAVLLQSGEYPIAGSLTIDASGVVLRGSGDGTNGTILRGTGTTQRTLVNIRGSGSASTVSGTTHNITDTYVPVGAVSFNVDSTSGLAVGDRVMVRRIATAQWIHDIGMDLLGPASGGAADVVPWTASGYNMDFDRVITRIEGTRIMIDAPITCAIEAKYAGGTIRKFTWAGRINNVGVEFIRGVSDFAAADDEAHAWTFIGLGSVENAWVRDVTSRYFGYACVALGGGTRCVTVQDCSSLDPVSIVTGGRRYAFVMDDCQLCLVRDCYTQKDRHQFVTQSLTTGPNVFVDGLSDSAQSDAGPHHRWGTGALWDNVVVNGNSLNVQNRGNLGTGHGWAGANEVVWNSAATGGYVVQNPPGAHNWLIGSIGAIKTGTVWVGPHDPGTYDSHGTNVFPNSLYYSQLQNRLSGVKVETREYTVGQIDGFNAASSAGTPVPVNGAWRTIVQSLAGNSAVNGFDVVTNDQYVPFTFTFALNSGERIASASLTIAMRAAGNSTAPALYVEDSTNVFTFPQLGWNVPATGTNTSVNVLDLQAHLAGLSDGSLNLALRGDVGIDWALLSLQVVPGQTLFTNVLVPSADAFVRNGTFSSSNFGTNNVLEIKADSSSSMRREAFLRWNLAGYSGGIAQARLVLTPIGVGTNGLEHALSSASSSDWDESALSWENQPPSRKRFATWIPKPSVPVEIMVTPQVQEALARDGQFCFELSALKDVGGPGLVTYASGEYPDPSMRPRLLLLTSNATPAISAIRDLSIGVGANAGPIPFHVSDPVYDASQLNVGVSSTNQDLVPTANIELGGSGASRTLTITPVPGVLGESLISVTVTNPLKQVGGTSFRLMVTNETIAVTDASGAWSASGSGNWQNPGNWYGGVIARGTNSTATFANEIAGALFVNVSTPIAIGNFVFGDAQPASAGSWILTNQPIILATSNTMPSVTVQDASATIYSVVQGAQGLNKQGEGTLVLSAANTYSGSTVINAGAVRAAHDLALGAASSGTSVQNPEDARLELTGNVRLLEPLTLSCKGSALGHPPALVNLSDTNTIAGPVTLTTGGSYWTLEAAGGKLVISGNITNSTTSNVRVLWLRGAAEGDLQSVISDSAGRLATAVRKDDTGSWTVSGDNRYSGTTTISNGTLRIAGTLSGPASVYGGQLSGSGLIKGAVSVDGGAMLSPGPGLATLTVSNTLSLADASITCMEVDPSTLGSDLVSGVTFLTYGGTLIVTNVLGSYAPGQSFQLFKAASIAGNFSVISPARPGPGLGWSFDPVLGRLSVVATESPVIVSMTKVEDGSLTLTGTGPSGGVYRVLATTNAALPAALWDVVETNTFVGGAFTFVWKQPGSNGGDSRFFRIVSP